MYKKGLIEQVLLNVLITICLLPLLFMSIKSLISLPLHFDKMQDEIAIRQIQKILSLSYEREYSNNQLKFRYQGEEFVFYIYEDKLILKPGTQIFLSDIDNFNFLLKDGLLYLSYERENKYYEYIVAKEKSIHLADFTDMFNISIEPE